jgi:two-component system OmpR family response regulator
MATILVCDESATIRISLTHRLTSRGHVVSGCKTIADAWHALLDGGIDLVVISRQVTDGYGDDLIRQMRQEDGTAAVPVAISAPPGSSDETGAADYFLPRPASRADVEAMLAALLPRAAA